jgi:hypothetical protein
MIGLATASISVYSFLAMANDQGICIKPGFRRSQGQGFVNMVLAAFPDFMIVKCGWKHVLGTVLAMFFLLVIFQQGAYSSTPALNPAFNSTKDPIADIQSQVKAPRLITATLPEDAKLMYFEHSNKLNDFVDWRTRHEDEVEQRDSLIDLYWSKRNTEVRNKTTAVCLAGNMRLGYADDMLWLHTLYRTIGSYDLFVWQGPESQPLQTGLLKPRFVSMGRSSGAPTGMNRRFKNRGPDNEDWAFHLWGFGHCASIINKHMAKTGDSYEFLLLSLPNATFTNPPIPPQRFWNTSAISFMPSEIIMEKVIFGPYKALAAFAPALHASIMSWSGSKAPRDYARHLAKARGYSIQELH